MPSNSMSHGRDKKREPGQTHKRRIAISNHLRRTPLEQEQDELLDAEEMALQDSDPGTGESDGLPEDDTDPGALFLDDDAYEPPQEGTSPFARDAVQGADPAPPSAALDTRNMHPLWVETENGLVRGCRYLPRTATAGTRTADAWKERKRLLSQLAERLEEEIKGRPMDTQAADKALDIAREFCSDDAEKGRRAPLMRHVWLFWNTGCLPLAGRGNSPAKDKKGTNTP